MPPGDKLRTSELGVVQAAMETALKIQGDYKNDLNALHSAIDQGLGDLKTTISDKLNSSREEAKKDLVDFAVEVRKNFAEGNTKFATMDLRLTSVERWKANGQDARNRPTIDTGAIAKVISGLKDDDKGNAAK